MIKKLLLVITILLLASGITLAIQDVDCDTSDDRGNNLCKYTGVYKQYPYNPFVQVKGDNNPSTKEEQDSFGTAGLRTAIKSDASGIEVSFGGGGMDYYGYSCEHYSAPGHCVGVDVKLVEIECYSDGNWESTPFYADPCPDGMCDFLTVQRSTYPRKITKSRCDFLSTTPVGKSYSVEYDVVMDYYDSQNNQLAINKAFRVTNSHYLNCTSYKGCAAGETCVAISDTQTACQSTCQCTSGDCCDGCNYKPEGEQPTGKTDGYVEDPYCVSNSVYQTYRDWKCTGTSSTSTYTETNKWVKDCSKRCENGTCIKRKILFVPVNWHSGDETKFNNAFYNHRNFFLNNMPSNCKDEVEFISYFVDCGVDKDSLCGIGCFDSKGSGGYALNQIRNCAYKSGKNPDYIIGIAEDVNICGHNSGYTCPNKNEVCFVEIAPIVTSAHELGHVMFDLTDEYDKGLAGQPNPLSPDEGCDPDINCCGGAVNLDECSSSCGYLPFNLGCGYCCLGNQNNLGGRCVMSSANAPEPRAFCDLCLNRIKEVLKC